MFKQPNSSEQSPIVQLLANPEEYSQPIPNAQTEINQQDLPLLDASIVYIPFKDDEELKQLLQSWGLENLYLNFLNEKITVDILKIMKFKHVVELLQGFKIGERVAFEHHFERWRIEVNNPLEIPTHMEMLMDSTPSTSSQTSARSSPGKFSPYEVKTSASPANEIITLHEILLQDRKGAAIKNYYENKKKLDEEHRSLLINAIVNFYFNTGRSMSLKCSYKMEQQITDMFPNEKIQYYRGDRRGKIYNRFCNMTQSLKTLEKRASNSFNINEEQNENNSADDILQIVRSLKYDNLTADEFDSAWKATSEHRIHKIKKELTNLKDVIKSWPEFKKPTGYRLMDIDFKYIFPNAESISENWQQKSQKILCFLKRNPCKDSFTSFIINSISDIDLGDDAANFKILWCLHAYLSPTGRYQRKGKDGSRATVRYTIKDSQESLVFVGQTMQELHNHIDFLNEKGDTIQPFILALGKPNFESFEKFFLFLDGHLLPFDHFIRAVDICFKSFHVFDLKYPDQSLHVWNFIELFFYKLQMLKTKLSTKACTLANDIDELNLE